jgi:hypothetical protein
MVKNLKVVVNVKVSSNNQNKKKWEKVYW